MKKSILILIVVVLGTVACNDLDEIQQSPVMDNYSISNSLTLSPADRVAVATVHNNSLATTMQSMDWSNPDIQSEILAEYSSLYDPSWGISQAEYDAILTNSVDIPTDISSLITNQTDFFAIYDHITAVVNSGDDYVDVEQSLEDLKVDAQNNLVNSDLEGALLMIETSKKSAFYWMPASKGGSGIGYPYLEDYWEDNDLPGAPDIGKAAAIDGLGATFGFLLIGFLMVPTPATLVGIIAVVGIRAAEASLMYVISAM